MATPAPAKDCNWAREQIHAGICHPFTQDEKIHVKVSLLSKERNSAKMGREEEDKADYSEAGPLWEQEEEDIINAAVTTRSLSLGELQHMQKDFSCCLCEHIVTWLL